MPEFVLSRWSALRLLFSVFKIFPFQAPFPMQYLKAAMVLDLYLQFIPEMKVKMNINN